MATIVHKIQQPNTQLVKWVFEIKKKGFSDSKQIRMDPKAKKSLVEWRDNLWLQSNYVEAFSFIDNLLQQK
jgi:hypothetical protein